MPTITAAQLAELLGGTLHGKAERLLSAVSTLESASPECVTFLANARYAALLDVTQAGVALVAGGTRREKGDVIEVADPYSAFVRVLEYFHPAKEFVAGIHETASISADAQIGVNVTVGPQCVVEEGAQIGDNSVLEASVFVGRNSTIGKNCRIYPNSVIRHDSQLGDRVILHSGVVIGADGFGFAFEKTAYRKIPQVGIVVIEDDVEIGANTTVDRATIGETRIGQGTKIDNLVQIAHNVRLGKHCVVAAQAGISGSTVFGDYCRVGGQAGFVGHIKIGDGAAFGAQSGISRDVESGEVLSGSPGRPHGLWKRIEAALPRLPELLRRVKRLEERLDIDVPNKESDRAR